MEGMGAPPPFFDVVFMLLSVVGEVRTANDALE
jgi:hypothetical protein